jgi:hypothetical protein
MGQEDEKIERENVRGGKLGKKTYMWSHLSLRRRERERMRAERGGKTGNILPPSA